MSILGAISLTRRRFAAGARGTDGRWTPGASTDSTIVGAFHPTSGRDLATLPEGERVKDWRTVYIEPEYELRGLDLAGAVAADHVSRDGDTFYEVRHVNLHESEAPLPHIKALAVAVQESG